MRGGSGAPRWHKKRVVRGPKGRFLRVPLPHHRKRLGGRQRLLFLPPKRRGRRRGRWRAAHDAQKGGARRARRDDERRNVPLPAPRRHKRVARFLVAKLARARALARVRRNVRALATSRISRAARANTSAALSAAPRPARSTPLREQKRRRRGNKAAGLYAVRGGNGRASGGPTSQAAAKSVPLVWSTTRVVAMSISTSARDT
jgi:hypothetical protein